MTLLFFSALALSPLALAQEAPQAPPVLSTDGELRLLGSLYPDPVLDTDGRSTGQGPVLDSRLRAAVDWRPGNWRVGTEWDLFDGQMVGDVWDIPGDGDDRDRQELGWVQGDAFQARRAGIEGRIGVVGVQAGLTTSHWGLGMVANDGAHDPVFGRNDFGDRVIRVRVAARPVQGGKVPLTFVLAGDRVVEDELAEWSPLTGGQAAWQGIASVLYGEADAAKLGLYGVYRHQTELDGERTTRAGVLDLYADAPLTTGKVLWRFACEGAGILGQTDRAQSYNARGGLDVSSLGLTGLVRAQGVDSPGLVMLRAGYASGDGDPDDGASHDFSFDRDFDAGFVVFDELLGAIDANAYDQLGDPQYSGGAPEGAEALVAEGAFRHAAFVQPVLGYSPLSWLQLKAGVSVDWSTAPISQAFLSYRNGGVPVNQLGQPTDGYALGTELDWAVTLGDIELKTPGTTTRPALLLQGGHALLAENLGGGSVTLLTATGRVRW